MIGHSVQTCILAILKVALSDQCHVSSAGKSVKLKESLQLAGRSRTLSFKVQLRKPMRIADLLVFRFSFPLGDGC